MKIRKAIIPAAGLGTRVLPASKACPKEMLNIVDKPAIQYIVEEAVASGITDILIITNRGKGVIEDHFDHAPELEAALAAKGKTDLLAEVQKSANLANIFFLRQKETKGLGHAVLCAEQFAAGEPVAVMYGDDVIIGEDPAVGQLIRAYEETGKATVGIKKVPHEDLKKYSSMKVEPLHDNLFGISDMIEKPKEGEEFSDYSILGRCVLEPNIFEILRHTENGAGGELQLTDAMKTVARTIGMTGVDFTGTRYDMGNKFGILKANIEVGLTHPETAEPLRAYLKELVNKL